MKVILDLSQSNSNLPMVSSETPTVKSVGLEVHLLSDPEWIFFEYSKDNLVKVFASKPYY